MKRVYKIVVNESDAGLFKEVNRLFKVDIFKGYKVETDKIINDDKDVREKLYMSGVFKLYHTVGYSFEFSRDENYNLLKLNELWHKRIFDGIKNAIIAVLNNRNDAFVNIELPVDTYEDEKTFELKMKQEFEDAMSFSNFTHDSFKLK